MLASRPGVFERVPRSQFNKMKRISYFAALATLVLYFGPAVDQIAAENNGSAILYKVSGHGLSRPSYLLGTFHAICPDDMIAIDKLTGYIDQTDQVIMEVDLDDPAELRVMGQSAMMAGKTLYDLYTPGQLARVDAMLKNALGVSAEQVKSVRPAMLAIMVATSPKLIGCQTAAVDLLLARVAARGRKQIIGIETVASQLEMLGSTTLEAQARDLYKIAIDPQRSADDVKALMAVYRAQESEKLYERATFHLKDEKEFQVRLFDRRNIAWIPKIERSIAERSAFIAVGAGHLGGKNGVVNLLRARGYELTPIRF